MPSNKAVFLHSPELEQIDYPPEVPFSTKRAARTRGILASMGLLAGGNREVVAPAPASRAQLERFHQAAYLDVLQKASDGVFDEAFLYLGLGTPDTPVFARMFDYAALAAGATLLGAELILSERARVAFNPSGGYHHARPTQASGFCYINDVALACSELADAGKRVAYLDIDAHHGDGVQETFYKRRDVLTISLHESGKTLYPGTGFESEIGQGKGKGYSVNLPLPVGTYDQAYLRAFEQVVTPLLDAYGPDVMVLELGMDGLAGDPLAHLNLTNNVYADILEKLLEHDVPILASGGGGYHLENTARGWALCWTVLSGAELEDSMTWGMGGVMLESTDWVGGLRDRVLLSHGGQHQAVDDALAAVVRKVRKLVFPIHGLAP